MTNCWPNGTLTCCWNSVPNKFWNSNSFCFLSFSEPSNWFQTIWMWTLLRMLQTTYYDLVTNMFQFAVPESADLFPRWTGDIVSAAHSASSLQLWTLSSIASRFFFLVGLFLKVSPSWIPRFFAWHSRESWMRFLTVGDAPHFQLMASNSSRYTAEDSLRFSEILWDALILSDAIAPQILENSCGFFDIGYRLRQFALQLPIGIFGDLFQIFV